MTAHSLGARLKAIAAVSQQHVVPAEIRGLVPDHDYVDMFTAAVTAVADASPEDWARTTVEGAPPVGRFLAWRVACQLRLDPRPENVGGWTIADRGVKWVRLAAPGAFMSAHMVFWVDDAQVTFATFVRFDRRAAAYIWGGRVARPSNCGTRVPGSRSPQDGTTPILTTEFSVRAIRMR